MPENKKIKVLFVIGPTASGKTKLAVHLAKEFEGEIISADSRQVYIGMDIGTGKDLEEYGEVKYHLIDVISPAEEYNLANFRKDAINAISDISSRNKLPVICGGSVLYIDCLLSEYELPGMGYDKEERKKLKTLTNEELLKILGEKLSPDEAQNKNRIIRRIERKNSSVKAEQFPFIINPLIIGVLRERSEIHKRIELRLKKRINEGMIEEVKSLHEKNGLSWEKIEFFGLEYKYIALFLQKKMSKDEMYQVLLAKIRNLARKQDVWFRKLERKGHKIYWVKDGDVKIATDLVKKFITGSILPEPQIKISEINYGKKIKT
ncbi:MAG TPA: tRNA (adenosine(37)-N6)-dimethylallyltransferase MiaA [Victivallales bacterium]|nr:tRNA (adenosine(37)-N6)-dimethylallyltransferase MiaA [Victivallales bacterium]HPO90737.1 tRNA (adenosine(37)-N6)-dimethylallyltransferase MiaA [Victivallales bacterium]HRR05959.1 tRNA (adenosine(37)-N6)-dimethylallyltransferase MiaA [Victivallales bacterium]HRR28140.1 tRNA (adenosine(37)-N6)-dimethylallyltransferase MiaA [Victivallales bacterium]HRU00161.1 tRNA (adenosine(37)-N6)-dimethylallyltransferase MiaA [Victivallales bacterium]